MRLTETIPTTPIQAARSVRRDEFRCLTSGPAGKIIPLAYAPLLREDRISRGRVNIRVEMMETVETLLNAVNVTVYAHFVPFLAFERFSGLDSFNRSYRGEPEPGTGVPIPFFETMSPGASNAVLKTLGLHWKAGEPVNRAVLEAYNTIVNYRRKARSQKLPMRATLHNSLAEAFWRNPGMAHIVPDFDSAMLDGELELPIASEALPLRNVFAAPEALTSEKLNEKPSSAEAWDGDMSDAQNRLVTPAYLHRTNTTVGGVSEAEWMQPFVELQGQGVRLSLANIDLAKKTAAFARLRQKYSGHSEEHIIDLMMEAIRVPATELAQPILLDRKQTILGYNKRHATDGENLAKSVTTGEAVVSLNMRTPSMNTGGIVMITCEIVPEQMYERQMDYFFGEALTTEKLPSFTRDYLDPEKVSIVQNKFVDVHHGNPDGTFGYAPLNHEWRRSAPRIGGKFHRQLGDPFNEARQRLWSVETTDPVLTEDFYLVNELPHSVFADTEADAFEITTLGGLEIVGHTVFGKGLEEDTGAYDAVADEVDNSRIVQVPAGTPPQPNE